MGSRSFSSNYHKESGLKYISSDNIKKQNKQKGAILNTIAIFLQCDTRQFLKLEKDILNTELRCKCNACGGYFNVNVKVILDLPGD